jgi:hypothetical protein
MCYASRDDFIVHRGELSVAAGRRERMELFAIILV